MSSFAITARNQCVKVFILICSTVGILSAIYASLSCRWFLAPADGGWDLNADSAETIGLFRYGENSQDYSQDSCHAYNFPNRHYLLSFLADANNYSSWMLTAQVCLILGPFLAFLAMLLQIMMKQKSSSCCCPLFCSGRMMRRRRMMMGGEKLKKFGTGGLFLLAAGIQSASVVSSTSWCGSFWDCPWMVGAHANAAAAFMFLLCWLVAICGYRPMPVEDNDENDNESSNNDRNKDVSMASTLSIIDHASSDEDEGEMHDVELGGASSSKLSAEELLGTNDPVIMRAVGQNAHAIREFAISNKSNDHDYNDDDNDNDHDDESSSEEE